MASRSLLGGAILLGVARAVDGMLPPLKSWGLAGVCGLFFFVGCHGVLAYVQQRVPTGLAAILLATIPLWITLFNLFIPGSARPRWISVVLLVPGVIGVSLIAGHEVAHGDTPVRISDILLLLGAALSWAVATAVSERRSGTLSPIALSGMELISGGVVLLAISALRGELAGFAPAEISAVSIAGWTYLTIAGTVVAFAAYVWLLEQVPAPLVATYTFVNPIIAVLLGWLLLGEQPGLWMVLGAALVILSVAGALLERGRIPDRNGYNYARETR
jgi:drug/metabolite transporter (DMT)-like permease